jgi:DNA-directed RNA polymerase II subunit RPB9
MLYPKEDPESHRLNFACRTCQYSEEATSSCVFRNILNNAVGETAGVTQDVGSDPTVGLPLCLLCGSVIMCEGRRAKAEVKSAAEDESH